MAETSAFTIRTATSDDVPGIARVLSRAFRDDPLWVWMFPDPETRIARSARFAAIQMGHWYIPAGTAEVAVSAEPGPVVRGVAVWTPPQTQAPSGPALLRSLPHLLELLGPATFGRMPLLLAEIGAHAPSEPHRRLEYLAVDPVAQGRGIGAALLHAGLSRADSAGEPIALETFVEERTGFYAQRGFATTAHIAGGDGDRPELWTMVRPTGI